MYKTRSGEPHADQRWDELAQSDTVWRFEHVEILQNVGYGHQPQSASESQTCIETEKKQATTWI